jgi:hypothetical protein
MSDARGNWIIFVKSLTSCRLAAEFSKEKAVGVLERYSLREGIKSRTQQMLCGLIRVL